MNNPKQKNNLNIQQYSYLKQFHPILRKSWNYQITAYLPPIKSQQNNINKHIETFVDWDDPYRNIKIWTLIDFLREFKLTK